MHADVEIIAIVESIKAHKPEYETFSSQSSLEIHTKVLEKDNEVDVAKSLFPKRQKKKIVGAIPGHWMHFLCKKTLDGSGEQKAWFGFRTSLKRSKTRS